jgi:hypothetical protein
MALLNRYLPENEPLAGDLVERFAATGSRTWFWWQVLLAIIMSTVHPDPEIRPLRLVDVDARRSPRRSIADARPLRRTVNLTASPIKGIGGLSLVCLGLIVAITSPGALLIILVGVVGGALLGIAMVMISRHRVQSQPGGGPESVLFGRR